MATYYVSDLHLKHEKTAWERGFNSSQEHDIVVLENIENTVSPGDELYILGDITYCTNPDYDKILKELNDFFVKTFENKLDIHLISGNHDRFHPIFKDSNNYLNKVARMESFSTVSLFDQQYFNVRGEDVEALVSHFCYSGDDPNRYKRFRQYRMPDFGMPIIHGDTHHTSKISFSNNGSLQVCLCLDAWEMQLASKNQIEDIMDMYL